MWVACRVSVPFRSARCYSAVKINGGDENRRSCDAVLLISRFGRIVMTQIWLHFAIAWSRFILASDLIAPPHRRLRGCRNPWQKASRSCYLVVVDAARARGCQLNGRRLIVLNE
ncbi:unnamed protein product [Rhodiola kirilowii]